MYIYIRCTSQHSAVSLILPKPRPTPAFHPGVPSQAATASARTPGRTSSTRRGSRTTRACSTLPMRAPTASGSSTRRAASSAPSAGRAPRRAASRRRWASRRPTIASTWPSTAASGFRFGLYTILPCPILYGSGVGGTAYIAHQACDSIVIVWAMRGREQSKRIDSCT